VNRSIMGAKPISAPSEDAMRPSGMRALTLVAGLSGVGLLAIIATVAFLGSPGAGEPHVTLTLDPQRMEIRRPALALGQAVRTVGGNLVSDLALVEDSPDGPLPKIAEDGRRPMTAYTRPIGEPGPQKRIAVVITGLGVSQSGTQLALSRLPPEVTLSFVPSISNLQDLIDQARGKGHEVLLEVPMEPFDFPDSDPGPNALMVGQPSEENLKRLHWNLTRATGYVGIGNILGGRFLGDETAVTPMMTELASRGLLFFDNGRNTSSLADQLARAAHTPIAVARIAIDDIPAREAVDLQLSELETEASRNGAAIGLASVFPVTIDRLSIWSAGLAARGYALVPLTAVTATPANPVAAAPASP
jgi:polysaccharide deacetylase 2 family uncharacterized protein YibQ